MKYTDTYQYSILEKLSYPRFGGTDGELRAAKLLQNEITALCSMNSHKGNPLLSLHIDWALSNMPIKSLWCQMARSQDSIRMILC